MIFFYTNPILIAAAVIPAVFLLVHVFRAEAEKDRHGGMSQGRAGIAF